MSTPRKQTTRYLKVSCDCCGWTARVTSKHLNGRSLRCPDEYCEGGLERDA
jgi:RNase P subunit RPR2